MYYACSCYVADPLAKYLPEPELIHDVDFGLSVWGLAVLNDELFVISLYHPNVYVFDQKTMIRFAILSLMSPCSTKLRGCILYDC